MHKRILSFFLLLTFCLSLAACGRAKEPDGPVEIKASTLTTQSAALRYRAEELPLPEGLQMSAFGGIVHCGERAYFCCDRGEETLLCSTALDGGGFQQLTQLPERVWSLCKSGKGAVYALLNHIEENEDTSVILLELAADGGELRRAVLKPEQESLYWLPGSILADGEYLYVLGDGVCFVYRQEDLSREYWYFSTSTSAMMAPSPEGGIVIAQPAAEGFTLKQVDAANKDFGRTYVLDKNIALLDTTLGEELYLSDNSVYAFNWSSGALEKRFSWASAGIYAGSLLITESGMLCSDREQNKLWRLTESDEPIPEGEEGPVTLTIATVSGFGLPYGMSDAILRWNQEHPGSTIEVRSYFTGRFDDSDPADIADAVDRLVFDINAGEIPDMYDLSRGYDAGEGLEPGMLGRKGYLEDLYPYIDASLGRDWFYSPLLRALEMNGKLYELVPQFSVLSTFGYGPDLGDMADWDYEHFQNIVRQSEHYRTLFNNDGHLTRYTLLSLLLSASGNKLIDWGNGVCRFDSDFFCHILEACGELAAEENPDLLANNPSPHKWIQQSTSLLYYFMNFSEPNGPAMTALHSLGTNTVYPGLPEVGNVFVPGIDLGISAYSDHKQECWEFLSEYMQSYAEGDYGQFSCSRAAMDREYDWWMNWIDVNSSEDYDILANNPELPDMMRDYLNVVDGCTSVFRYDSSVWEIVYSEAERYFAGQLTAQQTAAAVQGRVKIYLAEQR